MYLKVHACTLNKFDDALRGPLLYLLYLMLINRPIGHVYLAIYVPSEIIAASTNFLPTNDGARICTTPYGAHMTVSC